MDTPGTTAEAVRDAQDMAAEWTDPPVAGPEPNLSRGQRANLGLGLAGLSNVVELHDEINHYRRIASVQPIAPIQDLAEATAILEVKPGDPRANQYMGWWFLTTSSPESGARGAIPHLLRALSADTG